MATEFDDSEHYALFKGPGAIRTGNAYEVRWSEIVLASLRAQGVIDMVDGLAPGSTDQLWLDKNTDPAILKQYDPIGLAWMPADFSSVFLRPTVLLAALEVVFTLLPTEPPAGPTGNQIWNNGGIMFRGQP